MIDTTRQEGRVLFGMLAVLAEFERELIRERTKAGCAPRSSAGLLLAGRANSAGSRYGMPRR
jgi:DNA invertase Pin-like site-specific DNA recombinase